VSGPVVSRTSPSAIVKPGVEVAKVTGPTKPDAAPRELAKVALLSVFVNPEVGES
jgi:hypothetical protein